jgi:hypothetical protein
VAYAQLAPNEDGVSHPVRGDFGASNPVVAPQEIPLTQYHPGKCFCHTIPMHRVIPLMRF